MLEIRPYPYAELSQMMGTHDPEGISRRLDRWGVAFTEDGRKPQITYNIEKISDPFKVYCIIEIVNAKHLRLVIVGSITMDCREGHADPMTEAFLQMAGVFSQLELAMIRARVKSGMANARAKGALIGRPRTTVDDVPPVFLRHYPAYRNGKLNVSELSRVCNISRTTAYKYLSLLQ